MAGRALVIVLLCVLGAACDRLLPLAGGGLAAVDLSLPADVARPADGNPGDRGPLADGWLAVDAAVLFGEAGADAAADGPPPPDGSATDGAGPSAPVKINTSLNVVQFRSCNPSDTRQGLAPLGVCTHLAQVTNISSSTLSSIVFEVITLTSKCLLLNADGGAGGVGATVTVPPSALGGDGVLTPGETFTQALEVGLTQSPVYDIYVDLWGVVAAP